MSNRATATFEITRWDAKPDDQDVEKTGEVSTDQPKLSRATVTKTFQGEIEGTSTAEVLMCQSADGNSGGYIAQEHVEARVGGRSGSFVIQHGGIRTSGTQKAFGNIVPGSGLGELAGLRGEAVIAHDEKGTTLTLDYDFE